MKIAHLKDTNLNGYLDFCTDYERKQLYIVSFEPNREVYDGECEEIYAPHFLDRVESKELNSLLLLFCSKIEHGGKLIVGGTDLIELTKNIMNFTLNHETANQLIYSKNGLHSLNLVTNILLENNMQIVKKQINGLSFLVEATRP